MAKNRERLLRDLQEAYDSGEISKEELNSIVGVKEVEGDSFVENIVEHLPFNEKKINFVKLLYYLGGGFVVLGIVTFLGISWEDLSSWMRVGITLGVGLVLALLSVPLLRFRRDSELSNVTVIASMILSFIGSVVFVQEFGRQPENMYAVFAMIFLGLLSLYALVYLPTRSTSVFVGQTVFLAGLILTAMMGAVYEINSYSEYLSLVTRIQLIITAIAFLMLAWWLRLSTRRHHTVSRLYYLGGTVLLLAVAFISSFMGERTDQAVWSTISISLALLASFMSVYIKSRDVLIVGAIFIVLNILAITGQFFADVVGWPLAIILCGLILIAVTFGFFEFRKRFQSRDTRADEIVEKVEE